MPGLKNIAIKVVDLLIEKLSGKAIGKTLHSKQIMEIKQ